MDDLERGFTAKNVSRGHHPAAFFLKAVALVLAVGGIIACLQIWPDPGNGRYEIPAILYAIPLSYLLGGVSSAALFWGIAAIIERLSEIMWLYCTPEQRREIFFDRRPPI
tara:strand:+ start:1229 stop:1558 length:330 start_codon:yes stop_codon:yes gene_type:complete